ncbi:MAG: LysM peptidoglycan-binding domain-containing protein, partial [Firmicutes bacterium]|nr:LysM peptidoglycan-binding domain-containing protein [Bacillota bacterium]
IYIVQKGDTLWKLAKKFNTSVEDIARINDIENPDLIYPEQKLLILKRVE